jgi:hypothetical protein
MYEDIKVRDISTGEGFKTYKVTWDNGVSWVYTLSQFRNEKILRAYHAHRSVSKWAAAIKAAAETSHKEEAMKTRFHRAEAAINKYLEANKDPDEKPNEDGEPETHFDPMGNAECAPGEEDTDLPGDQPPEYHEDDEPAPRESRRRRR